MAMIRTLLMNATKQFDENQTIFEFALTEYQADESIQFKDAFASKFMNELIKPDGTFEWPGIEYFIHHTDTEISSFVAGVFSNDHQLSPAFLDNMIYVKTEEDNYRDELISIFLNIRRTKIEEIILSEQLKLQQPEEQHDEILEYLDFLNTVKIDIANKLGNVVSRF
jgi:hypothetical protein